MFGFVWLGCLAFLVGLPFIVFVVRALCVCCSGFASGLCVVAFLILRSLFWFYALFWFWGALILYFGYDCVVVDLGWCVLLSSGDALCILVGLGS